LRERSDAWKEASDRDEYQNTKCYNMISVLILTKNEEVNLPRCLASLGWCDDIVVLDSYSTDRTVEIARSHGARVIQRPFDNWSSHLNWAGKNISFRHPWLYYSDADEVAPDDLKSELLSIADNPVIDPAAFRLRYKNFFMGRWIKHCGIYPVWVLRFYRPDKVVWHRLVNPIAEVDGKEGKLSSHFHHFSFQKGMESWFEKHNKYSSDEARETSKSLKGSHIPWRDLLPWKASAVRRTALKELSFRLPFRPLLRFIYMYFIRLGILDGVAGFHYCLLLSIYEYMISIKMVEMRSKSKEPDH